ncbi:acetyl-CoA synthetase-like protein [Wallemia mellicola]|nr:acetyl-CoA synthetase-like protein [Wallemia mellicola]
MSTLTVPIERREGLSANLSRTRSSSFIRALADVKHQGIHSATFNGSPISSNLTIPEIMDYHTTQSPEHVSLITASGKRFTLKERAYGAYKGVEYLNENLKNAREGDVLGILAETEPILYSTMVLAAMRAGLVEPRLNSTLQPFPISNRNSPAAIEHLLKVTHCKHLIYTSTNEQLKNLAENASKNAPEVQLTNMPKLSTLYNESEPPKIAPLSARRKDLNAPALIIHSSGSTSYPKAIVQSNKNVMHWGRVPLYGGSDVCEKVIFAGCLPTFHAMGCIFQIAIPFTTGLIVGCFDAQSPPVFPTSDNIMKGMKAMGNVNFVMAPASTLKDWSNDSQSVEVLQGMDAVMFGGSPMSEDVGNYLVRQGINLSNQYGSTECGHTTSFFTHPCKDWQYITLSPHTKPRFVEEQGEKGVFELQFLACDSHKPAASNLDDVYGFATNDLVEIHPHNRNLVRVIGRKDDQLMLLNGEKTNPGPIEAILTTDPKVKSAVMFGRAKPVNGVIIEPASPVTNKEAFIDSIWHSVNRANQFAPQHSRIFRNYIMVSDSDRPFEMTPKGSVKRVATLKMYENDIEDLYKRAEDESTSDNHSLTLENAQDVLRNIVEGLLTNVNSTMDLFSQGCDSLQATMIRNKIRGAMPSHCKHKISQNVVFEHPRLIDLIRYVKSVLSNKDTSPSSLIASQDFKRMIKKYTTGFANMPSKEIKQDGDVYLVTGTTGSLGSYILSELVMLESCTKVYAVNRSHTGRTLLERQKEALESRGLDPAIATNYKVHLVEADTSKPLDNLDMQNSVTRIIHNAWRVNFNLSLESFEGDLQSLLNLTNFAISTKYHSRISFLSSIGVLANWKKDRDVPEETLLDENVALGLGYGESKYVGERMLTAASKQSGLQTTIIRSGQIAGSRSSGSWNSNEWLPSIIRSADSLNCLPNGNDDVAWLPVDIAARVVLDLSASEGVFSLVHPNPTSWNTIMSAAAAHIHVPLVSYDQWLEELNQIESSTKEEDLINAMNNTPALKLKQFFSNSTVSDERRDYVEALGNPRLSTKRSCKVSETLRNCEQLDEDDVLKWITYWKL